MNAPSRNTVGRYVVNSTSSVLTALIKITVLVWVNQYLLRRVDATEYALIPLITSLLFVAELFPIMFIQGISRFMVEADARQDGTQLTRIVSSMLPVLTFVALILAAGGTLAVVWVDALIKVDPAYVADARIMLALLLSVLCLNIVTSPFRAGLFVRMRFVELNLLTLAVEILRVALLLVLLMGVSTKVIWLIVASTAAQVVNILVLVISTVHILPAVRFRFSLICLATVRQLVGFSLGSMAQILNKLSMRAVPAILLNRHGTAVDVVSFHLGRLADMQIRKLVLAAGAPANAALTTVYALDGEGALQAFYYRGGRYFLWATLFLVPPLIVFAQPFIRLYAGETYGKAAVVMMLVLSIYPFTWASGMFYRVAYAMGRIWPFNVSELILAVATSGAVAYFVIVRDMGAVGAGLGLAGARAVGYLFICWPCGLWLVNGRWGTFLRLSLLPGCAPFVGATVACLAYGAYLPIDTWFRFFCGCGVAAAVYLLILLTVCLDDTDRALMARLRRKIQRRFSNRTP